MDFVVVHSLSYTALVHSCFSSHDDTSFLVRQSWCLMKPVDRHLFPIDMEEFVLSVLALCSSSTIGVLDFFLHKDLALI